MTKKSSTRDNQQTADIDAYLAAQPEDYRRELQILRETIRVAVPDAEEAMVYGVPGFKLDGKPLACYAGFKQHCGFYPMSPAVISAHAPDLQAYQVAKGTIRFQPETSLSSDLIQSLVLSRAAELRANRD